MNHRQTLPVRLIKLLKHYPPFLTSKFIINWQGPWSYEVFELIEGIFHLMSTLQCGNYVHCLNGCRDLETLTIRHDLLTERMNRFNRCALDHETAVGNDVVYPPPPLPGNEVIVPILDSRTLKEESRQQQHCVAAFDNEIRLGRYFVYKILEPNRATLGVTVLKTKNGHLSLPVDQLKGFQNRKVSAETEQSVLTWFYALTSFPLID